MNERQTAEVPVLVLGATALGAAAALRFGEQAVLAEKGGWAAWEFAASFEPGEGLWEASSPQGVHLKEELVRRKILSECRTHIQGAAPVFFQMLQKSKGDLRLLTHLVEIRPEGTGYRVTLADHAGFHTLRAAAILDTTSSGESLPGARSWRQRRQPEAIRRFSAYWRERGKGLRNWRIAGLSSLISERAETEIQEFGKNWLWMPSAGRKNLLAAYEAGRYLTF